MSKVCLHGNLFHAVLVCMSKVCVEKETLGMIVAAVWALRPQRLRTLEPWHSQGQQQTQFAAADPQQANAACGQNSGQET